MKNLEFDVSMSIFIAGAVLFLLASSGLVSAFNANDIHKTALTVESIGLTTAFIVYFREGLNRYFVADDY